MNQKISCFVNLNIAVGQIVFFCIGCSKAKNEIIFAKIDNKSMTPESFVTEFNKVFLRQTSANVFDFGPDQVLKIPNFIIAKKYFYDMTTDCKIIDLPNKTCKISIPCRNSRFWFVGYNKGEFVTVFEIEKE